MVSLKMQTVYVSLDVILECIGYVNQSSKNLSIFRLRVSVCVCGRSLIRACVSVRVCPVSNKAIYI